MNPNLFIYQELDTGLRIFFSDVSTADALALVDPDLPIFIDWAELTYFDGKPWVDEKALPPFKSVGEVVTFLRSKPFVDLINFEATIEGLGKYTNHDDQESSFSVQTPDSIALLLSRLLPFEAYEEVLAMVLANPGSFIHRDEAGVVRHYATEEELSEAERKAR